MTKKELLELLDNVPDDTVILLPGHSDTSGTYWSASDVELVDVVALADWCWSGEFQDCDKDNAQNGFAAVCIV
jgi:hypothetical protein